jgi:hypothetical protein
MWTTHYADPAVQPQTAEWLCHAPAGTYSERILQNGPQHSSGGTASISA